MKKCSTCGEIKNDECFPFQNTELNKRTSSCKECKSTNLKAKYGITTEDYNRMKTEQNNCCAICGEHEDNLKRTLCVDHCHSTGNVRGLLCDTCNKFLGFYEKFSVECANYLC